MTSTREGSETPAAMSSACNVTMSDPNTSSFLPKMNQPSFTGELSQWPKFRDAYQSLIHDDGSIPDIRKFHYLVTSVSGPALTQVTKLPLIADNYCLAWKSLLDRYDNKRLLASAYINELTHFKPLQGKPSIKTLNLFINKIADNIAAFKLLKIPNESDFLLYYLAIKCLDSHTREQFELSQKQNEFPTFDQLAEFIRKRCLALQFAEPDFISGENNGHAGSQLSSSKFHSQRTTTLFVGHQSKSNVPKRWIPNGTNLPNCFVCSQRHKIQDCLRFTEANAQQRRLWLKDWKGCLNCLSEYHTVKNCSSKWHCRFWDQRHHSLLHHRPEQPLTEDEATSLSATGCSPRLHEATVILGTAIVEIMDARGIFQPIRIVIDSGSQFSFVTSRCVKKLHLPIEKFFRKISAIGQTAFEGAKGKVQCTLKPANSAQPLLKASAIIIENITSFLPKAQLPNCINCDGYRLADPTFKEPGPIDFLMGCDLYPEIWTGDIISLGQNMPRLFASVFGHVVIGKISCPPAPHITTLFSSIDSESDLHQDLTKFWELEEISSTSNEKGNDPEEQQCEEHFVSNHARDQDGRYVVSLPFKEPNPIFEGPCSAMRRFKNLEYKLHKNNELNRQYCEFMEEYLTLGHMELSDTPSKYVIPHHAIFKEDRNQVKIRVVIDCSAKNGSGSLNEKLLVGPKLQLDIKDILLNFRVHAIVFVADVVKMYRQIILKQSDRCYQHVFWRADSAHEIKTFELKTLTYGLSSAPFLAVRVLRQLINDEGADFPEASQVISRDMYIDDIVTGADSIPKTIELKRQLVNLLGRGGFSLSKWASNSAQVLSDAHGHTSNEPYSISNKDDPCIKILGLQWDPENDSFSYRIKRPEIVYTKRAILSTVAKIYDPLGFLAPVTITAKGLIQELWKAEIGWDDDIPDVIKSQWKEFVTQLPILSKIAIPRFIFNDNAASLQILGFSDASNKAYSATIYIRIMNSHDYRNAQVKLVVAKTKLAPVKTISIPRLELCGALLLSRLFRSISQFMTLLKGTILEPKFYTDSTVVLGWIKTPSFKLKTFVANRVTEITNLTTISQWNHVRTEDNPSDCSSRGLLPVQIIDRPLWWNGPTWLRDDPENWPTIHSKEGSDLPELKTEYEKKGVTLSATEPASNDIDWMKRVSDYGRLLKAAAWMLRWSHNVKNRNQTITGPLTSKELQKADMACINKIQLHHFLECDLSNKQRAINKYLNLSPYFDDAGIFRVGGRLKNSNLKENHKHPVLLPAKNHFTLLLVDYYHRIYLHPGPALLQALIQLKFWVPGLRRLVRQRTFQCIKCYKVKANTRLLQPLMADLPECRFKEGGAFFHVGIDFAGPFQMRESLKRKAAISKIYLCLFVCMATKALHLEAVTNMSTEAFLACLNRFISRRGLPEQIYTDCGSNFIGANNQLQKLAKWFLKEETRKEIIERTVTRGIHWNFNPPMAPHFGGIWEAGVKSVKAHVKRVVGDTPLTFEEWSTLFSKIEAVLNSRPLCSLSTSPEETDFLSPGHFLIGRNLLANPQPTLLDTKTNRLSRWQLIQQLTEHLWKKWRLEYLSTLQGRAKWTKMDYNLKKGDLVLLKTPSAPVMCWPMARVVDTHPGSDGIVRVATVKTGNSSFKRPSTQLVPLLPLSNPHFSVN